MVPHILSPVVGEGLDTWVNLGKMCSFQAGDVLGHASHVRCSLAPDE